MISEEAKRRKKILEFWEKYGLEATTEAFGVSRRTLFRWKKAYKKANKDITALNPKPKRVRESKVSLEIVRQIRKLREEYPNIGKAKLYHLLKPFCEAKGLKTPSESTIGRVIAKDPNKMRLFPYRVDTKGRVNLRKKASNKKRKPKNLKIEPFGLWAVDTIQRVSNGIRRYILTMIDPVSRVAFAIAIPSKHAKHTAKALEALIDGIAAAKKRQKHTLAILSDNGSEFKKEFDVLIEQKGLTHYWTYPKSPKMNAHNERFNRTIQEQFVDYYEDLLFTDINEFNKKLADWLIDYNTKIPHSSLNFKSPVKYLLEYHYECHMYWTYTPS